MSPDGSKVYTLNFIGASVSVVDTASWQVTATISTGPGSMPIIGNTTPDGSLLGVTDIGTADVSLIDTSTNQVARTLKLEGRPIGIQFSPTGNRGYVVDFGNDSMSYEPAKVILAGLQGAPFPFDIPGRLTVFDPATGATLDTTTLGSAPSSVVVIPN
jgi:YVTN family beta-propeller protein